VVLADDIAAVFVLGLGDARLPLAPGLLPLLADLRRSWGWSRRRAVLSSGRQQSAKCPARLRAEPGDEAIASPLVQSEKRARHHALDLGF
jgi:hypothetical protein